MTKQEFYKKCELCLKANGLSQLATNKTLEKLYEMTAYMLEINSVMNLTAITDWEEIITKHLIDSLTASPYIPPNSTLLDVGCGGGFPSLPLAIARPDIRITALDSTAKKTQYVRDSAKRLGLDNLSILTGRAEELSHEPCHREQFDCVIARAVAALPILAELCMPFVKVGGLFLAMKGRPGEQEFTSAPIKLGGGDYTRHDFMLIGTQNVAQSDTQSNIQGDTQNGTQSDDKRTIIIVFKNTNTKLEYPRVYSQIKKTPL